MKLYLQGLNEEFPRHTLTSEIKRFKMSTVTKINLFHFHHPFFKNVLNVSLFLVTWCINHEGEGWGGGCRSSQPCTEWPCLIQHIHRKALTHKHTHTARGVTHTHTHAFSGARRDTARTCKHTQACLLWGRGHILSLVLIKGYEPQTRKGTLWASYAGYSTQNIYSALHPCAANILPLHMAYIIPRAFAIPLIQADYWESIYCCNYIWLKSSFIW